MKKKTEEIRHSPKQNSSCLYHSPKMYGGPVSETLQGVLGSGKNAVKKYREQGAKES